MAVLVVALVAGLLPYALAYALPARMIGGTWLAVLGVAGVASFAAIVLAIRKRRESLGLAIGATVLGVAGLLWNAFLYVASTMSFAHGRPFRVGGRAVTARVRVQGGWGHEPSPSLEGLDPAAREDLAASWTRDALAEHASVAAFAELTLDLMALGAPAALLEACAAAQRDEVHHARLCFAVASTYAGRPLGPGPLAEAGRRSAGGSRQVAIASLRDGCWHEQASADAALTEARAARDPVIAAVRSRLAEDEARHAELAWAILTFCLDGDPGLRAPILEEVRALEAHAGTGGADPRSRVFAACAGRTAARARTLLDA